MLIVNPRQNVLSSEVKRSGARGVQATEYSIALPITWTYRTGVQEWMRAAIWKVSTFENLQG
jgi:hypothetical protein